MSEAKEKDDMFDFDEISGGTTENPKSALKAKGTNKAPKKKGKTTETLSGVMLAIPTDDAMTIINKDISECTGEEFLKWAQSVHPHVTRSADNFNDKENRYSAFKQIVKFHQSSLSWLRSTHSDKENLLN